MEEPAFTESKESWDRECALDFLPSNQRPHCPNVPPLWVGAPNTGDCDSSVPGFSLMVRGERGGGCMRGLRFGFSFSSSDSFSTPAPPPPPRPPPPHPHLRPCRHLRGVDPVPDGVHLPVQRLQPQRHVLLPRPGPRTPPPNPWLVPLSPSAYYSCTSIPRPLDRSWPNQVGTGQFSIGSLYF